MPPADAYAAWAVRDGQPVDERVFDSEVEAPMHGIRLVHAGHATVAVRTSRWGVIGAERLAELEREALAG